VLETCRGISQTYYKTRIYALIWSFTKIILRYTVSKTSKTGTNLHYITFLISVSCGPVFINKPFDSFLVHLSFVSHSALSRI